jgi:hypothetical protein
MQFAGLVPDPFTFEAACGTCQKARRWGRLLHLGAEMRASGCDPTPVAAHHVLRAARQLLCPDDGIKAFAELKAACAAAGRAVPAEAFQLLLELLAKTDRAADLQTYRAEAESLGFEVD